MTIYQELKKAGCSIDSHYSDLYVKRTKQSTEIIERYKRKKDNSRITTIGSFTSQIDKKIWYELPFRYDPYWESKP